MSARCPKHQAEIDAWLDYRQQHPLRISAGATHDDTQRGTAERSRARGRQWAGLVRQQIALIESSCIKCQEMSASMNGRSSRD